MKKGVHFGLTTAAIALAVGLTSVPIRHVWNMEAQNKVLLTHEGQIQNLEGENYTLKEWIKFLKKDIVKTRDDLKSAKEDNAFLTSQVVESNKQLTACSTKKVEDRPAERKCSELFPGSFRGYDETFNSQHDYDTLNFKMRRWSKLQGTDSAKEHFACEILYQRQIWDRQDQ